MKRRQWNRLTTVKKAIAFWKGCRFILIIIHKTNSTYHHATAQTGFGQSLSRRWACWKLLEKDRASLSNCTLLYWPFQQPRLRRNELSPLWACHAIKIRSRLSNQSVNALSFLRSYYKIMNKKLACIFARLISLILSLAHYVNFIVFFPGS